MSPCPTCSAVRGAHRQEHYCDDCDQEGCTRCMPAGVCSYCAEARKHCPICGELLVDGICRSLSCYYEGS